VAYIIISADWVNLSVRESIECAGNITP
jgi:hypothetical protein